MNKEEKIFANLTFRTYNDKTQIWYRAIGRQKQREMNQKASKCITWYVIKNLPIDHMHSSITCIMQHWRLILSQKKSSSKKSLTLSGWWKLSSFLFEIQIYCRHTYFWPHIKILLKTTIKSRTIKGPFKGVVELLFYYNHNFSDFVNVTI